MLMQLNGMLAQIPGFVFFKNLHLDYIASSDYTARMCGFKDQNEFLGHSDFDLRCRASQSAAAFREEDKAAMTFSQSISCLQINEFADGKTHITYFKKSPLRNINGQIIGVCSVGNEITNPKVGRAIFNLLPEKSKTERSNRSFDIDGNQLFNRLSIREGELIFYLLRGMSIKKIAAIMSLSPRTVESYLETIKNKFNCQNKNELLDYCFSHGFSFIIPACILQNCLNTSVQF